MNNEGIAEIVAVEKEIQERIERERQRAEQLIEKARKGAEEDIVMAEEEMKRHYHEKLQAYDKVIKNEASEIIGRAIQWSERINSLNEEGLRTTILQFIKRIIPDHVSRDRI